MVRFIFAITLHVNLKQPQPMPNLNNIIVVDDDTDEHEFLSAVFSDVMPWLHYNFFSNGYNLIKALSAPAAQLPDAVFLDINMPGISGFDCLAALRSLDRLSTLPVIIYSTSRDSYSIQTAYDLGATYYMPKPDTVSELKDILLSLTNLPLNATVKTARDGFVITKPVK